MQFIILPALLVLMYLMVIRPQQQRIREQQKLVASLQVGEEVISSAGIYGRITGLTEDTAMLAIADGVEIRVARPAIARRVDPSEPEQAEVEATNDSIVEPPAVGEE